MLRLGKTLYVNLTSMFDIPRNQPTKSAQLATLDIFTVHLAALNVGFAQTTCLAYFFRSPSGPLLP